MVGILFGKLPCYSAPMDSPAPRGRGAGNNPLNRFERIAVEAEEPGPDRVPTVFLRDSSRTVIATNSSPDLPFDASLNPYRGCEHGCAYCYARPTHEYLGFSAGLDFESKILVKEDAPELLRRALAAPSWKPQMLALSGVTDPYQPVEAKLGLTRRCLEVLAEARNPVVIVTKNRLVARDADLLGELAKHGAARVWLSITSLDATLTARLEPRTSHPRRRLEAIRILADAGVPTGVFVAPIIPGLTEHGIADVLAAAAEAGATAASYTVLRLPGAVAEVFTDWLERHEPNRKDKVLGRVREMRDGKLNELEFGKRMRPQGVWGEQIRQLFHHAARRHGLAVPPMAPLSTAAFRRPRVDGQLALFV